MVQKLGSHKNPTLYQRTKGEIARESLHKKQGHLSESEVKRDTLRERVAKTQGHSPV